MDKIRGVNLGNWLVLEKWMHPALFEGTSAEDEDELCRQLPQMCIRDRRYGIKNRRQKQPVCLPCRL